MLVTANICMRPVGGGPHWLDSLRGRISYEPKAFRNRKYAKRIICSEKG